MIDREMKLGALLMLTGVSAAMTFAQPGAIVAPRNLDVQIIRVIRDPHTGMNWALERDPQNPGGPGRMVPIEQSVGPGSLSARDMAPSFASEAFSHQASASNPPSIFAAEPHPWAIRSGDRIVVEEHSAIVDARLEAVALGSAAAGTELSVRLSVGGKVVRVVALGPGHAIFARSAGAQ